MFSSSEKSVSLIEAARAIYRTRAPSEEQLERVLDLMKSGALSAHSGGKDRRRWTTTESALAECLARNRVHQAPTKELEKSSTAGASSAGQRHASQELRQVYRSIWRDYFLAVMLRRRLQRRSRAFRRWVLAGQFVLLTTMVVVLLGTLRTIASFTSASAEQQAIERWLAANTDAFVIQQWHPVQASEPGDGITLAVEYRYRKESPRWIRTYREFLVLGEEVRELNLDD